MGLRRTVKAKHVNFIIAHETGCENIRRCRCGKGILTPLRACRRQCWLESCHAREEGCEWFAAVKRQTHSAPRFANIVVAVHNVDAIVELG